MTRLFKPESRVTGLVLGIFALLLLPAVLKAQNANFHNAPDSARQMKNPAVGQQNAESGKRLYAMRCARCHGRNAEGSGNIPALMDGVLESVSEGELFWFITNGKPDSGMPAWNSLPKC